MGYRLSRIYTRSGDKGTTGLGDGARVPKDHPRIEAMGTVDELNSAIAVVLAQPLPEAVRRCLEATQNELFDFGARLCVPHGGGFEGYVRALEETLDRFNAELPPLQEFILPGGGPAAAACHLARTICRRAERRVVTLGNVETVEPSLLAYLNRLSDLLFVLGRVLARAESGQEVLWQPGKRRSGE